MKRNERWQLQENESRNSWKKIPELFHLQDSPEQYTRKNSAEINGILESALLDHGKRFAKIKQRRPYMFSFSHISYELNWKGNIPITVNQIRIVKSEERSWRLQEFLASSPNLLIQQPQAETGRIFLAENLMSSRGKIINGGNGSRRDRELSGSQTRRLLDNGEQIVHKTSLESRLIRLNGLED